MNARSGPAADGMRSRAGACSSLRQLTGPWWLGLLSGLVWLVPAAILWRFTSVTAAVVLLSAVIALSASDKVVTQAWRGLPPSRKLAGHSVAATVALLLTLVLTRPDRRLSPVTAFARLGAQLSPAAVTLTLLLAVIVVALAGGAIPALTEAVAGSLLLRMLAAPRPGQPAIAGLSNAAVLGVLVAVAVLIGLLAEDAARRSRQAVLAAESARHILEADRMRAVLLAAVSHDLRSPLAAATAALSCLRAPGIQLTAADQDELLAAADESVGHLARLADGLLDVSRLQAGSLSVFPRPADLGEIIGSSLGELGPSARAVTVEVPRGLPAIMADPVITERIIVNLAGNALRYAPAGSPLRLTASTLGDRVELRVIDRGPGIPATGRDQAFLPFRQLGTGQTAGVGLGLAVSRGLAEAMGGTLRPEETPGGGLTMALTLPAAA
jgi:K+-sensing histidine kinase KdpD